VPFCGGGGIAPPRVSSKKSSPSNHAATAEGARSESSVLFPLPLLRPNTTSRLLAGTLVGFGGSGGVGRRGAGGGTAAIGTTGAGGTATPVGSVCQPASAATGRLVNHEPPLTGSSGILAFGFRSTSVRLALASGFTASSLGGAELLGCCSLTTCIAESTTVVEFSALLPSEVAGGSTSISTASEDSILLFDEEDEESLLFFLLLLMVDSLDAFGSILLFDEEDESLLFFFSFLLFDEEDESLLFFLLLLMVDSLDAFGSILLFDEEDESLLFDEEDESLLFDEEDESLLFDEEDESLLFFLLLLLMVDSLDVVEASTAAFDSIVITFLSRVNSTGGSPDLAAAESSICVGDSVVGSAVLRRASARGSSGATLRLESQ